MTNTTSGHLSNNGGVRGHSAGDIFPWLVMGQGVPGSSFRWILVNPSGEKIGTFFTSVAAYSLGRHLSAKGV